MGPRNVLLVVTVLLCALFLSTSAQSIFPSQVSGEVGDSVSIFCVAVQVNGDNGLEMYDRDRDAFINYEISPDGLQRLTRFDDRVNVTLTNFTISPLMSSDNGAIFRCANTGNSTISVNFAPILTRVGQATNPVQVSEGEMATIAFDVSANPPPGIMWTRNGQPVINGSGLTATAFSIILNPADRIHDGMYTLVVTNTVGSSNYSFDLDVLFGPIFSATYSIPSDLNNRIMGDVFEVAVFIGQNVTLVCDADGNPTPNITQSIPQGSRAMRNNNNIVITEAASGDAGSYSCAAGDDRRNFQLFVGGAPRPLRNITVTINAVAVNFTWVHDDSVNAVPTLYFVANVTQRDVVNTTTILIPAATRSLVIPLNTLRSEQSYNVSVVVRNLQGDSEPIYRFFTTPTIGNSGNTVLSSPWSVLLSLLIMAIAILC